MPDQDEPWIHRGADIEILDRSTDDHALLTPSAVRINGVDIAIPADAQIQVHDLSSDECVTVTITMFARSLSIRHEPGEPQS